MTIRIEQVDTSAGDLTLVELADGPLTARFLDVGATLWRLRVDGDDLCLHHADPADYRANAPCFGATPGPVANRIAGAEFDLDGRTWRLEPNEGPNQLHGGPSGFATRRWAVEPFGDDAVAFRLHRAHGDGGYPGNLDVEVVWRLSGGRLRFEWSATTDRATPVSLTNHAYWNLAGGGTIHDHVLRVDADRLVVVDDEMLPTGELLDVAGTPYDLRAGVRLGDAIDALPPIGIDHSYLLDDGAEIELHDPGTGRSIAVRTSLPAVQVYTAGNLAGRAQEAGAPRFGAVCLETQYPPDAVHHHRFASPVLPAGGTVRHWTEYRFGT